MFYSLITLWTLSTVDIATLVSLMLFGYFKTLLLYFLSIFVIVGIVTLF